MILASIAADQHGMLPSRLESSRCESPLRTPSEAAAGTIQIAEPPFVTHEWAHKRAQKRHYREQAEEGRRLGAEETLQGAGTA